MTEPAPETLQHDPPSRGSGSGLRRWRLYVGLLVLVAAGMGLLWLTQAERRTSSAARGEALEGLQQQVASLEERQTRDRAQLAELARQVGAENAEEGSLAARLNKIEQALADISGTGGGINLGWRLAQAEYYLRAANAQETLAGDPGGALTALQIADEHLRDAGDPRLTGVRRLIATEIAALRTLPKVDVEGLVLKLGALSDSLESLPRQQAVPVSFTAEPAPAQAELRGWDRAVEAVRNALLGIVSVRRPDAPVSPLMTDEAVSLLIRSIELELQMARLALLKGQAPLLRDSLARVRLHLEKYFDMGSPQGAAALALVNELTSAPIPGELPDISASLTELLRIRERERAP